MKTIYILLLINLNLIFNQPSIIGNWKTDLDNSIIKIDILNNVIEGKIIKSDDPKNIGVVVIKSVKNNQVKYKCEIYDPKVKKYFDATIELLNQNKLQVKASCCFGLFSETYIWNRL